MAKTLELSDYQMQLLSNILSFRVIVGEPLTRQYDDDIKDEMRDVIRKIKEAMEWE